MLQIQGQNQQPLTTAHLAQTMSLLVLSNQELRDEVLKALADNPALELLDERVCPTCRRKLAHPGPCPICSQRYSDDGPIVFMSPRDSYRPSRGTMWQEEPPDREPAAPEDLSIHVLQQLASELEENDRPLAAYILASLDEDGFLQDAPPMIARLTRSSLEQVHRVLDRISHVDPPGLATEGPRQALLAQLDVAGTSPRVELARQILTSAFNELGRRNFDAIAEQLEVSLGQVRAAASYIQEHLNPYPSRSFWANHRQAPTNADPNVYHEPDIQISQNTSQTDGPLVVEIFSPVSGWLRVNPIFRKALAQNKDSDIPEAWAEHLEKAALFVKCIQQRNNTMRRMMKILVKAQRGFILEGDRRLKSMTRAEIAEELGVHESTVSRAVSSKSVALPDGRIIPMAKFFDRSLPARDCIKEIVRNERQALTDDEIAERLERYGVHIARRTVAKYRSMEGILPARLRHQKKQTRAAQPVHA
jgi:RNA polymerase sigma-54 factor